MLALHVHSNDPRNCSNAANLDWINGYFRKNTQV